MELCRVALSFGVLFLLCAFLTLKCGLHSALAPLTALGLAVTWLTAWGVAGPLYAGMWLLCLGSAALGGWALAAARGQKGAVARLFTPGAVLFWGLCAAFAVYFFIRRPLATDFDEFSFWATAAKLTRVDHRLYTTAVTGLPWQMTQNPGLPLLSYFFQFFGAYADWKLYLAYNVLAFAVFAAVLGSVRWGQYRLAVPLAAACWCAPWFFTVYNHTVYRSAVYMSSYGDIPAGLAWGGAVALWLFLRRNGTNGEPGGPKWAVLPVLMLAANIKSNTFVLALVAAGLIAADHWLFSEQKPFTAGFWRRTGFSALCLAAPMSVSLVWGRYAAALVRANAAAGGMGETSEAIGAVAVNGVKMLLGLPVPAFYESRRAQFYTAMADMSHQFWSADGKMSMLGQGCVVAAFLLCLLFGVWLAAGSRRLRARVLTFGALTLCCFGGYNLMLALSYGFIFKPFQAQSLTDYNRYIYSFYIGWFILALALLSLALQPAGECSVNTAKTGPRAAFSRTEPRLPLLGQAAVLILALGMLWRVNGMVLPQLSVLGFSDSEFADRRLQQTRAEQALAYLTPADRIFYVRQGDNGLNWFKACYDFYPVVVDRSGDASANCGGTFGLAELKPTAEGDTQYYYHPFTADQFDALVRGSGCTYLYTDAVDSIFVQSYGALFTDGLAGVLGGQTTLYRVTDAGFAPVAMEEVPAT